MKRFLIGLALVAVTALASADQWPQTSTDTHSQLMVRLPPTLQSATQAAYEATLERWVGNSFVTFDDWGHTGYGDNVVVIYSGAGKLVKKFALRDIMTAAQIEKLPRTIGSLQWGGQHILDLEDKVVELRVGDNEEIGDQIQKYRSVRIRMTDGAFVATAAPADAQMVVVPGKDVKGEVFKRLGLPNQAYCWEQCLEEARCTATRWAVLADSIAGQCQLISGPLTFIEPQEIKTEDGQQIRVTASRRVTRAPANSN